MSARLSNAGDLRDEVVIVTGAGRGIGRVVAETLLDHGASVTIAARTESEVSEVVSANQARGRRIMGVAVDVSDASSAQRLVDESTKRWGDATVLVNNAGVAGAGQRVWEADPEKWWKTFEVNLRAPMLLSRLVLPAMLEKGRGTIVNTGSYLAIHPHASHSDYAASKAALARFTDSLALEIGVHGPRVYTVSPGWVHSRVSDRFEAARQVPAAEWNAPDAMARLVVRLVRGEAPSLSGCFLHVRDDLDELNRNANRIREDGLFQLRLVKLNGSLT